ncbi:AMSH-like ubiquitin thioesterase 1 isoform X1 [Prunus yedoensis var. nudiflora]|uniref:AMSH-like ubiquitin thioesterase 1 isoform X1 n=1 Tax=Prunus yedoensis var. nudiflora TaxID=2094558 RepID=A0A314YQK2_PRUYE|nr:AMSH-like ubiquitin thioesterase 1 isoform X1 [Prunus yedoensis var. nudiflora]
MRSSCSDRINIAASAQKLDVDNRIPLRIYFRIANNILKQADIFRQERNIIDLYIMLLRFSSLVSETIPCHREYRASVQGEKVFLKKKLFNALNELEELKPAVKQKNDEFNRRNENQNNGWGRNHQIGAVIQSPLKKQTLSSYDVTKAGQFFYQTPRAQQFSYSRPVEDQFRKLSVSIPHPKEETLSRHSILGPNGLHGQWQPPRSDIGVRYPSILDLTPIEIPRLGQSIEEEHTIIKDTSNSVPEKTPDHTKIIRQPSPPPVLAEVQDLIPAVSPQVPEVECGLETLSSDDLLRAESPLQLHISTTMMEHFMKLAKSNTDKNLETCGVLAGSLKNRKFFVTALIIPKQESTSDSCQTTNEEEIFEVQDKQSLFPLGWIHTHPTQSCFMSSIDLHTHYSYQIMLPEAVAIVMAPRGGTRTHGIFRLTTPGGMSVIRQCQQRGFHPHDQPPDGGPIYNTCADVYMNPNLKFDVIDLR